MINAPGKKCMTCGGRGKHRYRGDLPAGTPRVTVLCAVCNRVPDPPLSVAILEAFAEAGEFEADASEARCASTKPPPKFTDESEAVEALDRVVNRRDTPYVFARTPPAEEPRG